MGVLIGIGIFLIAVFFGLRHRKKKAIKDDIGENKNEHS
jgi:hypothetical protein